MTTTPALRSPRTYAVPVIATRYGSSPEVPRSAPAVVEHGGRVVVDTCLAQAVPDGAGHPLDQFGVEGGRPRRWASVTQTADGTLHIAYTHFRQAIKYVRVRPEWVDG